MKYKAIIWGALLSTGILSACGNSTEPVKEASAPVNLKNQDPCLTKSKENPGELLTLEMVSKYANGKEVEQDARNVGAGTGEYNFVQYTWAGEGTRKVEVANMSIDIPNTCSVQLSGLKWIEKEDPVEDFNRIYKTVTEEDMAKLKEQFRKQMDETEEISEESKEPGKQIGEGLMSEMNKTNYEEVSGVGDAAKWETSFSKMSTVSQGILRVQMGRERFHIDVDLGGDDSSKSKAAAIELAKAIIQNCK